MFARFSGDMGKITNFLVAPIIPVHKNVESARFHSRIQPLHSRSLALVTTRSGGLPECE
jgi:hypothetical protein